MKSRHPHADDYRPAPKVADDLPLFAAPSVPVATSEAAAESVRSGVRRSHDWVLALLYVRGPLTSEELRLALGWDGDYCRPRCWELEGMLMVEKCDGDAGRPKLERATQKGRMATCYQLTALGKQRVQEAKAA